MPALQQSQPAVLRGSQDGNPVRGVNEAPVSAVTWSAVLGGAFAAAAMALILTALGTGLGLAAVSPWSNMGASATTIGIAGAIWLIVMQASAGGLGGYVAGRLRTRWVDVHTDEVYFRDTAHGLLSWAVAVVISAGLLATAATTLVGASAHGVATGAAGAGVVAATAGPEVPGVAYYVDTLFRTDRPSSDSSDAIRAEAGRIMTAALSGPDIAPADKTYLSQLVAARTGLSPADADKRVGDTLGQARAAKAEAEAKARAAADATRKAGAYLSMWMFVSLLASAFCASYAATIGGRQRDAVVA